MKKRVRLVSLMLVVLMILTAIAGCTNSTENNTDTEGTVAEEGRNDAVTEDNASENKSDIKVAVVLHALNGSFYTKMKDGAEAAGKDLGIEVNVSAPNQASSLEEQVTLIETAIASKPDAIATVLWDQTGFNGVVKEAKDAGIPVIAFNMNSEEAGAEAFIGQDFTIAGYELGKYIFGAMGGEGKYIVASCAPTDTALVEREAGVDQAAKEYGGKVEKIATIDIGTDLTNAYGVIENAILANPDVKAIIGVDVFSEAIGNVISDYDKAGEIYAGGFDLTEGMLNHVKNGDVQVTVGQNPFLQGYYAVLEAYLHVAHSADFLDINTGAQMVDAELAEVVEPE
jgi:ABC-type sugar transport system substrate-binding protein